MQHRQPTDHNYFLYVLKDNEQPQSFYDRLSKTLPPDMVILYPDSENPTYSSSGACLYKACVILDGQLKFDSKGKLIEIPAGNRILSKGFIAKEAEIYSELINIALKGAGIVVSDENAANEAVIIHLDSTASDVNETKEVASTDFKNILVCLQGKFKYPYIDFDKWENVLRSLCDLHYPELSDEASKQVFLSLDCYEGPLYAETYKKLYIIDRQMFNFVRTHVSKAESILSVIEFLFRHNIYDANKLRVIENIDNIQSIAAALTFSASDMIVTKRLDHHPQPKIPVVNPKELIGVCFQYPTQAQHIPQALALLGYGEEKQYDANKGKILGKFLYLEYINELIIYLLLGGIRPEFVGGSSREVYAIIRNYKSTHTNLFTQPIFNALIENAEILPKILEDCKKHDPLKQEILSSIIEEGAAIKRCANMFSFFNELGNGYAAFNANALGGIVADYLVVPRPKI